VLHAHKQGHYVLQLLVTVPELSQPHLQACVQVHVDTQIINKPLAICCGRMSAIIELLLSNH
jgi:hypothetical protein